MLCSHATPLALLPRQTVDKWCRAPRHVILATLEHIDTEYHGISAYMTQIGFGPKWQRRLREVLLRDPKKPPNTRAPEARL